MARISGISGITYPYTYGTWVRRNWLPSARDSLRWRRRRVGDRWWPLKVLLRQAVACRAPEPMQSPHGGFGWRCQRIKGHAGAHRFRNYVWFDGGEHAHHAPLPIHGLTVTTW